MRRGRLALYLFVLVVMESGCGGGSTPVPTAPSAAVSTPTLRLWQGAFTTCAPPIVGCNFATETFVLRLTPTNDGLLQIERANAEPVFAVPLSGSKGADGTLLLHGTFETHMLAGGAAGTRTVDVQLSSLQPLQGSIAYDDNSGLVPRNNGGSIVFARELQVFPPGRFDGQWFGLRQVLSCAGFCDAAIPYRSASVRPVTLTLADSGSTVTGDFNGLLVTGSVSGLSVTLNGHYQVAEPCPSASFWDVVCSWDAELSLKAGALDQLEGTVTERYEYRAESSGERRSYSAMYQLLGVARWP